MKNFGIVGLVLSALTLSACQSVTVDQNGGISQDAVGAVNPYLGNYQGSLSLRGATTVADLNLLLVMDGNRPVVAADKDILGEGCESKIGKLKSLDLDFGLSKAVAIFELDPGKCANRIAIRDENGLAQLNVYVGSESEALVTIPRGYEPQGGCPTRPCGGTHSRLIEYRGSFKKN